MNAVILAAGVGHRFHDLTLRNNKALLPIGGIPTIERTILYLKEAGIHDITIVTGHMHELFKPLVDRYDVVLLHNRDYSIFNNLHSLELVLDKLSNTYLIHGDVVLFKNIFKENVDTSFFYTVLKNPKGVPTKHPIITRNRKIKNIEIRTKDELITTFLGISYWNKENCEYIRTYFRDQVTIKMKKKYHGEWEDEVLKLIDEIDIEAHQIDRKYAQEMNMVDEYFQVCMNYEDHWKKVT